MRTSIVLGVTDVDFSNADVQGTGFYGAILERSSFRQANLANAKFDRATLTAADFTGAEIRGASFVVEVYYGNDMPPVLAGTGIKLDQLYSTQSYQSGDLREVDFGNNEFAGANFAGKDLTDAGFGNVTLTGAEFTDAVIRARFGNTLTLSQIISTGSYIARDLRGVDLHYSRLAGANFTSQNFENADLGASDLSGANFRQANLANANFVTTTWYTCFDCIGGPGLRTSYSYASLIDADLMAADARGASGLNLYGAITTNLIESDGHIKGLELEAGDLLIVRDYDGRATPYYGGNPPPISVFPFPLPSHTAPNSITIDESVELNPRGTLRMVFEADAWDSTISFARHPGRARRHAGTHVCRRRESRHPARPHVRRFRLDRRRAYRRVRRL